MVRKLTGLSIRKFKTLDLLVCFQRKTALFLVSSLLLRVLTGQFASAIALWPFVFVREKKHLEDASLMCHERIHLRQQKELLVVFFYLWYGIEFIVYRVCGKSPSEAYRKISFEREAYAMEAHSEYLKNRPFWNFLKWLRTPNR